MARDIFERVDSYRRRLGITVEEMCRRLDSLGWPVSLSTMNGMLGGKRASVSISEVFLLARVLEVPPIGLIAPIAKNEPFAPWPDAPTDLTAYDAAAWIVGRHVYWKSPSAPRHWSPTFVVLERADSYTYRARRLNAEIAARQFNKISAHAAIREMRQTLTDLAELLRVLRDSDANPPRLPEALEGFLRDSLPRLRSGSLRDEDAFPINGLTTDEELEAAVGQLERELGKRSDFEPALYSDLTLVVDPDGTSKSADQ